MSEQDEQDPKQFLQEVLCLPSGAREPSPPPPPNSRVGGDPRYRMRKGSLEARPGSIQFLREHILPTAISMLSHLRRQTGLHGNVFVYFSRTNEDFGMEG